MVFKQPVVLGHPLLRKLANAPDEQNVFDEYNLSRSQRVPSRTYALKLSDSLSFFVNTAPGLSIVPSRNCRDSYLPDSPVAPVAPWLIA